MTMKFADLILLLNKLCLLLRTVRAINVFGEWKGKTAAGCDPVNRMKNPRFILTVPGWFHVTRS